ncbi:hypothetical protein CEXT_622751 [Caerostris extrusa]|uniref:Uncharacterized protein n=1 Tax=Caerostris extrusa TaxID=172846 RepID=A0AAV4R3J5_CAEEX|nr:hypothetical protein CEXT_622751 [Caerostris extrusa]
MKDPQIDPLKIPGKMMMNERGSSAKVCDSSSKCFCFYSSETEKGLLIFPQNFRKLRHAKYFIKAFDVCVMNSDRKFGSSECRKFQGQRRFRPDCLQKSGQTED